MLKKLKKTISAPILMIFVLLLLYLMKTVGSGTLTKGNVTLSIVALQIFILVLPSFLYIKLFSDGIGKQMRLRWIRPSGVGFLIALFVLLVSGSVLIRTGVYYLFRPETMTSGGVFSASSDSLSFWELSFALALVPALTEEFLFRGVLLSEYAHSGSAVAAVSVSLFFAFSHFDLISLPVYFFGGLIFAFAVYVTESLFASVFLHFFYNLFSLFFEDDVWSIILRTTSPIFFVFIVIIFFFLSLLFTLRLAERIEYKKGVDGMESPPEEKRCYYGVRSWTESLLSPTFLICVAFYLIAQLILP